ncbi:MAG: phage portal protein, partial [Actinobacteria bacterium]|nr:phage portal protein [Actinomycetota bacterium]
MLTDLDFLNRGQAWPPPLEKDRLDLCAKNKQLFEGDHINVYKKQFERIERVIGNFQDVVSYVFVANFQKLISLKVADLLLGEAPKLMGGDEGSKEQDTLNAIVGTDEFRQRCYKVAIDCSRY